MIKVIAFDYGGVIKLNDNDLFGDICSYLKIDKKDWSREYSKISDMFNTEDKAFEDVMQLLASQFNDSKETKDFIKKILKESKGKNHINIELIDIIRKLKNKGYKTPMLSNNSSILRKKLTDNNILNLFDEIIISAEVGYAKPNPEIFKVLFARLNVKPDEVAFVDNSPQALMGADKIGYIPILYKDNETLKTELSNILKTEL